MWTTTRNRKSSQSEQIAKEVYQKNVSLLFPWRFSAKVRKREKEVEINEPKRLKTKGSQKIILIGKNRERAFFPFLRTSCSSDRDKA